MRTIPLLGTAVGAILLSGLTAASAGLHREGLLSSLPANGTPVIVELFASEGCSSCPAAEEWLASLDRMQPIDGAAILVLEEPVDYWDTLGWKDPFGQAAFSERQTAYAHALPDHRIYTPEVIIDGHAVVQSGDEMHAARDIRAAAKEARARIGLSKRGERLAIEVTDVPPGAGDVSVWLAITESGLSSDVARGENSGRHLVHPPVVRSLLRVGRVEGARFYADVALDRNPEWAEWALRYVVFAERTRDKRILGANALPESPPKG